jgi:O-antigen/teichoic acid export membrane protein
MSMIRTLIDSVVQKLPAVWLYVSSTSTLSVGIAAQSIGFVVLARWLGSEQFGHLSMITSVTSLGAAWCGLGTGEAMRRRVGRDPALYPTMLGHGVIVLVGSGAVLTVILSATMTPYVRVVADPFENFRVILLLVLSNMFLFAWVGLVEQILLTRREFTRANLVNAGFGIARAAGALVACLVFSIDSLPAWAIWNFAVSVAVSLTCAVAILPYGAPRWRVLREEIPLGVTLSLSGSIAALRQNIDLLALSAIATPHLIGAYGVARRIISMAVVTGASLDRLIYAKLAIAGQAGPSATLRLAQKYVVYAIGLTGMTSVGLFVLAPLLPWLFGEDFRDAIWILRALCWTLILTAIQFIAFDALNAADRHRTRLVVGAVVGIAGGALIVGFSSAFGITGTFLGVYLTELSMAVALWTALNLLSDRQTSSECSARSDRR